MPQSPSSRRPRHLSIAVVAAVAVLAIAALFSSLAGASTSKRVVGEAHNSSLGSTVLVAANNGLTLYSLSAEKNGRFICTGSCNSIWKPLTVPAGTEPVGPVHLGTIVRPDGRTQVTFRGLPLYRFTGDTKPGDVSGEGIRDVGVWHAAGVKG